MDDNMQAGAGRFRLPIWLQTILIGRNPKRTLVRIIVFVVLVFLMRAYVLTPVIVKGGSMLPTFEDGGINFVNRLAYLQSEPKRGDVVFIRLAGESVMYLKRVIGLPGETVQFHRGRAFVDEMPLEEPYVKECDWETAPEKLDPGCYYVVGDNRSMPENAHTKGRANKRRIVGKVLLCKNLFASYWR